ncbi:AraC family transcriptional regulator [Trinickia caryophylli]|uniref:Transcriptional regulator, AraC family n=1 Tax=Trinickia caryophylli TaxID=28094 RepID=A0A1X7GJG8_TRICW|nr:AraC family transcriptional regulator [Trinickia caryophylli]PMS09909.1 AraC family transcriptional regulator [Trinickia caryophylli]TRX14945.1 helix-turn-helix transcriptional regulator [Trinickia caryophylli]WQE14801.1 AraC family transcriptional regulator [Trinickia caryophylli]SMF70669.1 transcriptional regulator, AraC family [Trinickia caryophylli]GLU35002.1 AraC family transcriptional regulator [Trinickia caryophylli]
MISTVVPLLDPAADVAAPRRVSVIDAEEQWRCPAPHRSSRESRFGGVTVSRWTLHDMGPLEVSHPGNASDHCIALNLKCASLTFSHAGRRIVEGRVLAGVVQVTAPGMPVTAVFESAVDAMHLFVSQDVLGECYEDVFHRPHAGDIVLGNPNLIRDPALERLGQALAVSQTSDAALGKVFTESVSLAIVSRLVGRHFTEQAADTREPAALPPWRMKRVIEYIDAHLSESIGLADIARSAGLTRMHFAAQFRRATGVRPHEYLLRRRIEHAQHLLRTSKQSVIDVALSSGFRSQAHFTTVFKRFVGQTPFCWRSSVNEAR